MRSSPIQLAGVAFAYAGSVPVLDAVSFPLTAGFTGIVGATGAGKSTLLALLAGTLAPTRGHVQRDPASALVVACPQDVASCPADAHALAARTDADAGRWRGRLALAPADLARWPTLSPGERRRWQLASALARAPDVLLLDEPTNHVDGACRALLVAALREHRGVGVVASHDRALLDALTHATIRVHGGGAQLYAGAYTAAKAQWEHAETRARAVRSEAQRAAATAARQLHAARQEHAQADAARSAGKRKTGIRDHDETAMGRTVIIGWAEARLGKRVEVARRAAERAAAAVPAAPPQRELGRSLFVDYAPAPGRWLCELAAPAVRAGDAVILRDVRLAIGARDRVRIAGRNGSGKTTLLGALRAACRWPAERVLALPQELPAAAGPALVATARALPRLERGRTLSLVAALGVDPDRVLASAAPSPGETRKLALALGLGRHAWGVILDEPTNHLDLPAIERLEAAIAAFPGAVVLVSHDDAFAARLTTRTLALAGGRVTLG